VRTQTGVLGRHFVSPILLTLALGVPFRAVGDEARVSMTEFQYACTPCGMDLETLQACGVTLLSHIDWTPDMGQMKRYLQEAHARGIKVLPYVSPEKAWYLDTPARLKRFNRRNSGGSIPYYQAVDPSSHPEWILIDELGRPAPRYGSYVKTPSGAWELKWGVWHAHGETYQDLKNVNPWSWYMCSSAEGYIDAVERGVRAVMDMGFDGVFVDNTYTGRLKPCHALKFGKHKHRNPKRNTDKTYFELTERIYQTVKRYGRDKIVLLNGGTQHVYRPIRDGSMIESYVASPGARDRRHKWPTILEWARVYADEPKQGRIVTALSYLGSTRHPDKDDCFYAYACAQLSAFKWTADSPRTDIVRLLYRARLIRPSSGVHNKDGLWYRHYDKGLVVVNPEQKRPADAWLPLPEAVRVPVELYTGRRLPTRGREAQVCVSPESGRVVVDLSAALDNHLVECATTLAEAAERLKGATDEDLRRLGPLGVQHWRGVAKQADALAASLTDLVGDANRNKRARDDGKVAGLLAKIHALDPSPRFSCEDVVCRLNQADDHACQAAALISGLAASFSPDRPALRCGQDGEIALTLTNYGDTVCHVDEARLRLPLGWDVAPPTSRVGKPLRPGECLKLPMRLRLPADCKLPEKRLCVRAHVSCRGAGGRAIPCGASCFVDRVDPAAGPKTRAPGPKPGNRQPPPKKGETQQGKAGADP